MKTVSRNKFMLCFRPVVDNMDLVLDHPNRRQQQQQQQQLLYLGVDRNPSLTDSPKSSSITPRPRRTTLSQAVKAVVFETKLAKRVREKNGCAVRSCDRDSNSSRSKRSFRESLRSQGEGTADRRGADGERLDSDWAPLSSSCSSSFSTKEVELKQAAEPENRKSREESESKRKEERRGRERGSGLDSAVHLAVVSLTLTVLWGRVCAIFFTLICLYLVPRRQVARVRAEEDESKRLVVVKTKWSPAKSCRKKVIMEGLLDRTTRRIAEGAFNS